MNFSTQQSEEPSKRISSVLKKAGAFTVSLLIGFTLFGSIPAQADAPYSPAEHVEQARESGLVSFMDLPVETQAALIEAYFAKWDLPAAEYAYEFVYAGKEYGLDARVLAAIAMKESTGFKAECKKLKLENKVNGMGYGGCKIGYPSYRDVIWTVAKNFTGNNPRTAHYYNDSKTFEEKLYHYNSVNPAYEKTIKSVMATIYNNEMNAEDLIASAE